MRHQLRLYDVNAGQLDEFLPLWRDHVVAARAVYGFEVVGAWADHETSRFAWVIAYNGPETFAEAEAAYYASPERAALPRDPKEYLASVDLRMFDPVPMVSS